MNKKIVLILVITAIVVVITIILGSYFHLDETIIIACIEGILGLAGVIITLIFDQKSSDKSSTGNSTVIKVDRGKIGKVVGGDYTNEKSYNPQLHTKNNIVIESNNLEADDIVGGNYIDKK